MPNINLKDKDGNIVTYNGINKIQIQNASGGNALFVNASGAITITKNGSYDVTTYQNAIVNIDGASNLTTVAVPLAIKERTILPDGDYDGFSEIFVQGLEGSVSIVDSEGNEVEIESMEIDNGVVNILISGDTNEIDAFIQRTLVTYRNDKITSVGSFSFKGLTTLTELYLPNVTIIKDSGFGSNNFTILELPKLNTIMTKGFDYCRFEELKAPLKVIGAYGISGNTTLKRLVITQNEIVCTIQSNFFQNTTNILNGTASIYVPDELVEQYKVATNWSVYAEQIKPLSDYVEE